MVIQVESNGTKVNIDLSPEQLDKILGFATAQLKEALTMFLPVIRTELQSLKDLLPKPPAEPSKN